MKFKNPRNYFFVEHILQCRALKLLLGAPIPQGTLTIK
jgi:hypothetical protein